MGRLEKIEQMSPNPKVTKDLNCLEKNFQKANKLLDEIQQQSETTTCRSHSRVSVLSLSPTPTMQSHLSDTTHSDWEDSFSGLLGSDSEDEHLNTELRTDADEFIDQALACAGMAKDRNLDDIDKKYVNEFMRLCEQYKRERKPADEYITNGVTYLRGIVNRRRRRLAGRLLHYENHSSSRSRVMECLLRYENHYSSGAEGYPPRAEN